VNVDYDAVDRINPPVFVNNTRTKVTAAASRDVGTADPVVRLECRVRNLGERTVRRDKC